MFVEDNPLFENFVDPTLCERLHVAGLIATTNFKWVVRRCNLKIETDLFDIDDYYKSSTMLLHDIDNPIVVPAYSIRDIEKCLPAYLLTKTDNTYEISLDRIFDIGSKKSTRLADVYAVMLMEAIEKNIVSLPRINFLMAQKVA